MMPLSLTIRSDDNARPVRRYGGNSRQLQAGLSDPWTPLPWQVKSLLSATTPIVLGRVFPELWVGFMMVLFLTIRLVDT